MLTPLSSDRRRPLRTSLWHELFVPTPGRGERTLQLVAVTSIVVLISMTNGLPEPGLSAYIVFFVSKEDAGRSILISVVFTLAIAIVIGAIILLLPHTLTEPSLRILVIAGLSFTLFFLASASKLAPLAGTLGLIFASALNAEENLPTGEIALRAIFYILLVALFPILVQIAFTICLGRWPDRLLRQGLRARLALAADMLRGEGDPLRLDAAIAAGNGEFLAQLKMAGFLHALPKEALAQAKVAIVASFGVLLAVRSRRDELSPDEAGILAERLAGLAERVVCFPAPGTLQGEPSGMRADEGHPVAALVTAVEDALAGVPAPPSLRPAEGNAHSANESASGNKPEAKLQKKEKDGFFKAGAFTDPSHERFAAKATAAAMICYFTFNILDWPKISTCLVTVFIVALSTNGESTQKMTLRITGCTLGAAVGYAAIVFVLPHVTEISGLLILMACITLPAGWLAFGSPRVSYIGFQMAFAAYLCVLQGSEPKFDLAIARDRFVGILFGNLVVYAVFVSIYPTSLLPGLSRRLAAILGRCRAVVRASREAEPVLTLVGEIAAVQGMVAQIDQAVITYGFEKRSSRCARLHTLACRLIQRALHGLVADVARLATLPPDERDAASCAAIEARLDALAGAIEQRGAIDTRRSVGGSPGVMGALHGDLDRLAVTAARYRRIAGIDGGGSLA